VAKALGIAAVVSDHKQHCAQACYEDSNADDEFDHFGDLQLAVRLGAGLRGFADKNPPHTATPNS
jgi:hypothetical protein